MIDHFSHLIHQSFNHLIKTEVMKKLKMKSLRSIFILYLIATLLPACAQDKKADKQTEASSNTQAPDVDIHTAILYGKIETVRQHITAGTDLNTKEPLAGSTPLISAITFDHSEIVNALIDAGADLEVQNNDGSTALHVAAFFCRVNIVERLVEAKVDQSKKNNFGATALETVSGPFEDIKPTYEFIQAQLGPYGLQLDLVELEKQRPIVADILK